MNPTIPALSRIAEIEARFGTPPPVAAEETEPGAFGRVLADVEDRAVAAPADTDPVELLELGRAASASTWAATTGALPEWTAQLGVPHPGVRRLDGLGGAPAPTTGAGPVPAHVPFADRFNAAGAAHGVPPTMLAAVGFVESRYQPDAVSPAGARGVMQLMPFVADELGVDATVPAEAIDGAARLLAQHRDRFGSWELALASYFSGAGAVSRAGNVPPTPRSQRYVDDVLARMEQL